jgi:hypothetical protein
MDKFVFLSIGPNCQTSRILNFRNYKKESYPLDWLGTYMKLVNYLIKNNFSEFLDRNNFFENDNKIYLNINFSECQLIHFFHKDPFNNESDFNYTVRCVNRFNNLKNNVKCKLFFYTIYDNDYNKDDLSELYNTLDKIFNNNYKIILINYIRSDIDTEYNIIYENTIIINIYLNYNPVICYDLDKKIEEFFQKYDPINDIVIKL